MKMPNTNTKYCRTCSNCLKMEGTGYYRCGHFNRNKTADQICHTTTCSYHTPRAFGEDIITGKPYKYRQRRQAKQTEQPEQTKTFWQRVKEFAAKFEALAHHA